MCVCTCLTQEKKHTCAQHTVEKLWDSCCLLLFLLVCTNQRRLQLLLFQDCLSMPLTHLPANSTILDTAPVSHTHTHTHIPLYLSISLKLLGQWPLTSSVKSQKRSKAKPREEDRNRCGTNIPQFFSSDCFD